VERERWGRITDLFGAALERPPNERNSFLGDACRGDEGLLREVVGLLSNLEESGDFLERPLFSTSYALAVDSVIGDRYRIEALIGRGGMGEVYLAHDQLVDEKVALKTLRRDLGDNSEFLRRFRREVQLARKVTHPSVCRVFEVGVHHDGAGQQVQFFAMQLLTGETLAARVRRGRLPKDELLTRAREMADGLDAAHAAGIAHRDFKSANVMLCDGRAVIMDFGLARTSVVDSGMSQPGGSITVGAQVAGTVAYMSPEQLSGGVVTTSTDIYSFGVVLFEMATGRLPFNDEHIIRSAMQRALEGAPDVRSMAPELDAQSAAVIARCLRLDPAKRFASAGSAVAELQNAAWRPPMVYWTRRQWAKAALGAAAAAGGLALIPAALRFYSQDVSVPEGAEVLLGSIDNSTGDSRFDGITELFRNQLAQSTHFGLVDEETLGAVLEQMGKAKDATETAALREVAWRLHAALAVFGNVSRIGSDYALNVQVETRGSQPDAPRSKALRSFSASDSGALMRAVRDASVWIREAVGESASSIASFDRLPEYATTPSWEALTVYARGEQFFMKQDFDAAILEFEAALLLDPEFTLAALRRADLLMSQGRHTDGLKQWHDAIRLLDNRPVTRAEELNARGMFAHDSGDFESADRFFRTWALEYPRDWRAPYYRVVSLMLTGRAAQALELLAPLRRSVPDYGDIYAEMIAAHLVLGQTDEARALLPELRKRNRPERADLREGYIRFREGDCVGYLEILRSIRDSSTYSRARADAVLAEALLLIDCGLTEAASATLDAFLGTGSWAESYSKEVALRMLQAWAEMLSGNGADAVRHATEVLEKEKGPVLAALGGSIFARTGQAALTAQVLEVCAGFDDVPLYQLARHRILGEEARFEDRQDIAIQEFRAAAALEPQIAHRQYLMEALPPEDPQRLELALNAVRIPWQLLRPPPLHCAGSLRTAVPVVLGSRVNEEFARRFEASRVKLATIV
jgi:tetratricopeptide (TPR) repeat protein/tRNA A-37 threonylcarbamoyl transferase component Bud32